MERSSFKKSLLLQLYLKAILTTPFVNIKDKNNMKSHKNALYTLKVLLFNIKNNNDPFECFNEEKEEDFIKTNIITFDSYNDYNDLIININPKDLSYEDAIVALRSLLDKEKDAKDITYEKMLNLTYDYYNSIPDKEIRNAFNKVYKERNKNISIEEGSSYSLLMPTIDYALITLGRENESYNNMLFDLIHEYGHLIQTTINKNLLYYSQDYEPVELTPVFFNILSLFYFKKLLGCDIEKNIIQMQTAAFLNQVKYTKEIKEKGIEYFKQKYNDATLDLYFDHSSIQVYSYLIPMLTSFELLTKYKEDPEKSLYLLKKLIMNNKDYLTLLNENNIHLGENTNEAIKMLKNKEVS